MPEGDDEDGEGYLSFIKEIEFFGNFPQQYFLAHTLFLDEKTKKHEGEGIRTLVGTKPTGDFTS